MGSFRRIHDPKKEPQEASKGGLSPEISPSSASKPRRPGTLSIRGKTQPIQTIQVQAYQTEPDQRAALHTEQQSAKNQAKSSGYPDVKYNEEHRSGGSASLDEAQDTSSLIPATTSHATRPVEQDLDAGDLSLSQQDLGSRGLQDSPPSSVIPQGESLFSRALSDNAQVLVFSYSPQLKRLVSWSGNSLEVLGASESSLVRDGNLFLRHVHPDDRFGVLAALECALEGSAPYRIAYRWVRPDRNEVRWLLCRAALQDFTPAQDTLARGGSAHAGRVLQVSDAKKVGPLFEGMIIDVSETGARIASHPGDQELPSIKFLEGLPELFFTLDRDFRLSQTNRREAKRHETDRDRFGRNESTRSDSSRSALPSSQHVQIDALDFGDTNFDVTRFSVGRPVLEAFGTETLRLQYGRVFEQILSGALDSYRTRLNHVEPPLMLQLFPVWSSSGEFSAGENPERTRGEIHGILGIVSEHSVVAGLERQVMELRKAESMRSLASGVSHHVNNVLQGILGQATLIQSHPGDTAAVAKEALSISELVQRASELMQQLFLFDDSAGGRETAVDLNLAVMTAVSAIEDLFANPIELQVSFGNPLPVFAKQPVVVELIQELLRVARNCALSPHQPSQRAAFSHRSPIERVTRNHPGESFAPHERVILSVKTLHCDTAPVDLRGLQSGKFSQLLIAEHPSGSEPSRADVQRSSARMESEHGADVASAPSSPLRRIRNIRSVTNNPAFRRAQASAARMAGTITVALDDQSNFAFSLFLPSANVDENSLFVVDQHAAPEVLIVDDDLTILGTIEHLLRNFGYECVTTQSGSRALAMAHAYRASLKLVLLDAIMPGEDSVSLLSSLQKLNQSLKIVGFTGAGSETSSLMLAAGASRVLKKPVEPSLLRDVLHSLIGTSSAMNS